MASEGGYDPEEVPQVNSSIGREEQSLTQKSAWRAVMNLSALEMDKFLECYLGFRAKGVDINEQLLLQPKVELEPMEVIVDYFFSAYVQGRHTTLESILYLKMVLLLGQVSLKRLGPMSKWQGDQLERLGSFSSKTYQNMPTYEKSQVALMGIHNPTPEELTNCIKKFIKRGETLVWFCGVFGTGSIYWLTDVLSNNFIDYRMSQSGTAFEQARIHLTSLGLLTLAETSGANDFSNQYLNSFKENYAVVVKEKRGDEMDEGDKWTNVDGNNEEFDMDGGDEKIAAWMRGWE